VYPRAGPRSTTSRAEVAVYEALAGGLPDGWLAWHSLRLRVGREWEGEGDFVIAAPDRGLLILEVKGGRVELADGSWYQNGARLDRAPRAQGLAFATKLGQALRARGADVPPWGVACAFPDVDFSHGPDSGDLDGLVIGPDELRWLGDALPALMERAVPAWAMPRRRTWLDALHALWGDTWVPQLTLAARAERAAERALALNREQLRVLDLASDNPRALVSGGAGTGKTVVARELCLRRARDGERALYLCFTDALAHAVDLSFAAAREDGLDVRAVPIRRYACELLGRPPPADDDGEAWQQVSLAAACDALPAAGARPALVVVDEAQDLEDDDWQLALALADGRDLWAFQDEAQRFWHTRRAPADLADSAVKLTLSRQERNPRDIADLAAAYARDAAGTRAPAADPARRGRIDPSVLRAVVCDQTELLDRVRHELTELRRAGAAPEHIAVLSLAGRANSELLRQSELGGHRLVPADSHDAPESIVADTFLRFKGLDRPYVIVTELMRGSVSVYSRRMHIAITRATVAAIVVCSRAIADQDPRIARLGEGAVQGYGNASRADETPRRGA
jgi:hypothetical protein